MYNTEVWAHKNTLAHRTYTQQRRMGYFKTHLNVCIFLFTLVGIHIYIVNNFAACDNIYAKSVYIWISE